MRSSLLTRWVIPIVGAGLAIGALIWLYKDLDIDRFIAAVTAANPLWLLVLGLTILAEQLLRGWKWRQILYDLKPISGWRLFGAILAGYGANVVVPLGVSPFVRSWLIARLESLRMASVLVTAAIERFVDGIVFALIVGFVAAAGQIPRVEGELRVGLAVAGALTLILFAALLWLLFKGREPLTRADTRIGRFVDWLASKGGWRFDGLRSSVANGIVWPRQRSRQLGILALSVALKVTAATHFLWAGLAVGVVLGVFDYLFLLVFAGFAIVIARFVRVPGGFVIGSGYALKLLGVADAQALSMVLFVYGLTVVLMVGVGFVVLWRSGLEIRSIGHVNGASDEPA